MARRSGRSARLIFKLSPQISVFCSSLFYSPKYSPLHASYNRSSWRNTHGKFDSSACVIRARSAYSMYCLLHAFRSGPGFRGQKGDSERREIHLMSATDNFVFFEHRISASPCQICKEQARTCRLLQLKHSSLWINLQSPSAGSRHGDDGSGGTVVHREGCSSINEYTEERSLL